MCVGKIPPLVGLVPPWDQMYKCYKMSVWEKIPPLVDWSHCGTKCHKMSLWEKIPSLLALFMPLCCPAGAARLALPPQQPRYLGKVAETVETPAISLELTISATALWAALPQQRPRKFRLRLQYQHIALSSVPPRGTQHIQAPIPLAQASVRSPLTLQKERTRNLQVPMVAASTAAHLSSGSR